MNFYKKKLLKIQYLLDLVSKIFQIIFIKFYIHEGLSKITRVYLYSPLVFSFDLSKTSEKRVQFSITFSLYVRTLWNQLNTTQLNENFSTIPRAWQKKKLWFGDHNVTNKTNKLPSFIFWSRFNHSSIKWKTFRTDNLEL